MKKETKQQEPKSKVLTMFNYDHTRYGEKNFTASLTVPDETMTLRQILDNHSRGIPYDITKIPIFNGEEDLPDLRRLDLSEIQALKESALEVQDRITKHVNTLKAEQKEKAEKEIREKLKLLEEYQKKSFPNPKDNPLPIS